MSLIGRSARSSPASNRYIRGEDVSGAVMGVDRLDVDADVNEVDATTSTQAGLARANIPAKTPGVGGKASGVGISSRPMRRE